MLAIGRRLAVIWSTETRLTLGLATVRERRHGEVPGLLFAKGNCAAKQPELDWIAADGGTRMLYLRAFDKTENHEPLDHRISGID